MNLQKSVILATHPSIGLIGTVMTSSSAADRTVASGRPGIPLDETDLAVTATTTAPSPHRGPLLALLAFSQFIIAVDYNIVYVALPDIGRHLSFSGQSLQWVVSAYAVGFGGLLLFGGRAVDRIGQRRIFVLALAVYGVASVIGGLATSPGVLVGARVVQGIGGALLTPATLAVIATRFTEGHERNRALGIWGATGSSGLAAGALIGGVLTNYLGWSWVFLINIPMVIAALVAAGRLLPADPPRARGTGGFDILGALVATAGSSALVFGLVSGPASGWFSVRGVGALAVGAILLGLFLVVEARGATPLAPPRLFRNRSLVSAMAVILVFQSTLGGTYYILTIYVQDRLHYDALQAGLAFLPLTAMSILAGGKVTAALIARRGIRATLFGGMICTGASVAVLALGLADDGSFWTILPGLACYGFTAGGTFAAMFMAAASGVAPGEQGVAGALATTSQQIGGASGLAVLVAIANAGHSLTDGLRIAALLAAVATLAGAFFALIINKAGVALPESRIAEPDKVA